MSASDKSVAAWRVSFGLLSVLSFAGAAQSRNFPLIAVFLIVPGILWLCAAAFPMLVRVKGSKFLGFGAALYFLCMACFLFIPPGTTAEKLYLLPGTVVLFLAHIASEVVAASMLACETDRPESLPTRRRGIYSIAVVLFDNRIAGLLGAAALGASLFMNFVPESLAPGWEVLWGIEPWPTAEYGTGLASSMALTTVDMLGRGIYFLALLSAIPAVLLALRFIGKRMPDNIKVHTRRLCLCTAVAAITDLHTGWVGFLTGYRFLSTERLGPGIALAFALISYAVLLVSVFLRGSLPHRSASAGNLFYLFYPMFMATAATFWMLLSLASGLALYWLGTLLCAVSVLQAARGIPRPRVAAIIE